MIIGIPQATEVVGVKIIGIVQKLECGGEIKMHLQLNWFMSAGNYNFDCAADYRLLIRDFCSVRFDRGSDNRHIRLYTCILHGAAAGMFLLYICRTTVLSAANIKSYLVGICPWLLVRVWLNNKDGYCIIWNARILATNAQKCIYT